MVILFVSNRLSIVGQREKGTHIILLLGVQIGIVLQKGHVNLELRMSSLVFFYF